MNAIRCPKCQAINQLAASQCYQCGMPFGSLPSTAYVSLPVEQTYEAQIAGVSAKTYLQDNEIGRKTVMWYKIYCGFMAFIYLAVVAVGIFISVAQPEVGSNDPDPLIIGIVYAALGGIFLLAFVVALSLPRKPYNWIVGIVFIALGMTSCCLLPFMVPLLIYWIKPETQAYFGRK